MKNIKTFLLLTLLYYCLISLVKLLCILAIIVFDYTFETDSLYNFDAYTWVIQGLSLIYIPILTSVILLFLFRKQIKLALV